MVSKMICLFLLGMLQAEHAAAEDTTLGKAMAKFAFAPAAPLARPASPVKDIPAVAATGVTRDELAMIKTLANLEEQSQELKAEYQYLRARVQKLPQADVEAPNAFRWLAALTASVGLAAAIGVAAVRKYTGQEQRGSESATTIQVPLVPRAPQRAGPIVAQLKGPPISTSTEVSSPAKDDLKALAKKLNPVIGYWDPLGLSNGNFWDQGNDATIGWLNHSEIKHGRIAMAGFVGYCVHENHIHWPWKIATAMPDDNWYAPYEGLSAADIWFATPEASRVQIILFMGFFEFWSESSFLLKSMGQKHYMRGGKPGCFPPFDYIPHPVPLNLFDPFEFQKNKSDEWKAEKLIVERNNGRLAMIGLMAFLSESKIPGSVPLLNAAKEINITPMNPGTAIMSPLGPVFDFLADKA